MCIEVICNYCVCCLVFFNKCSLFLYVCEYKDKGFVMQCLYLVMRFVVFDQMVGQLDIIFLLFVVVLFVFGFLVLFVLGKGEGVIIFFVIIIVVVEVFVLLFFIELFVVFVIFVYMCFCCLECKEQCWDKVGMVVYFQQFGFFVFGVISNVCLICFMMFFNCCSFSVYQCMYKN